MRDTDRSGGASNSAPANHAPCASDVDMSGVDPMRLNEVRRRLAVVRGYLALEAPDDEDRSLHAKSLGLSVNQFMALTRAWREHRSGASVAGSGAARGRSRATGPRHLAREAKATAVATLAALPAGSTLAEAEAAVGAACTAVGQRAPAKSTIWKMLMASRNGRGPSEDGVVIVGRCWIRLPVEDRGRIVVPEIVLAVRAADAAVIAASLGGQPGQLMRVAALAAAEPALRRLDLDDTLPRQPTTHVAPLVRHLPPATARRGLARVLGNRIGNLQLAFRADVQERPERLLRARKDSPLSPADAAAIIRTAVDTVNAERGAPRVLWID